MTLYEVGWSCFGVEAVLGLALVAAAVLERGDAAARGLAQVYALACLAALALFAVLLGLSTWLRLRAGIYAVIVLMAAPVLFFIVGVAKRI